MLEEIASGGMATVYLGRLMGPARFGRMVAIKRLHDHLARDEELVSMLLDEARMAGRIQHPNVVAMLDVVTLEERVLLVMEYVEGETLHRLQKLVMERRSRIPPPIASAVIIDMLRGLHAAHEAKDERGGPLSLIHRDVTPHNIMLRRDGTSLVVDFGIAKAAGQMHTTEEGKIKGKLPYMAPEQVRGDPLTRRVDIYAAGAVLWEALVGERFVRGASEGEVLERLLFGKADPPSKHAPDIPSAVDALVLRALARDPAERFGTAAEMARALEDAMRPALPSRVAEWLEDLAGEALSERSRRVAELERALVAVDVDGRDDEAIEPPRLAGTAVAASPIAAASAASEPSDTSSRRAPAAPKSANALRFGGVAAATLVVGGTLAALLAMRSPDTRSSDVKPAPPAVSSPAFSVPMTAAPSAVASPPPSPAGEVPSATSTVQPVAVKPPSKNAVTAPQRVAKKKCEPVTIDATGRKRYHPECMDDGP
ncbi:serine/threonine protein kinase [Minicystis rosea]|nr:serine/threonine protein kinase [Minicystis rosea]